jgi:hypothetical protein
MQTYLPCHEPPLLLDMPLPLPLLNVPRHHRYKTTRPRITCVAAAVLKSAPAQTAEEELEPAPAGGARALLPRLTPRPQNRSKSDPGPLARRPPTHPPSPQSPLERTRGAIPPEPAPHRRRPQARSRHHPCRAHPRGRCIAPSCCLQQQQHVRVCVCLYACAWCQPRAKTASAPRHLVQVSCGRLSLSLSLSLPPSLSLSRLHTHTHTHTHTHLATHINANRESLPLSNMCRAEGTRCTRQAHDRGKSRSPSARGETHP